MGWRLRCWHLCTIHSQICEMRELSRCASFSPRVWRHSYPEAAHAVALEPNSYLQPPLPGWFLFGQRSRSAGLRGTFGTASRTQGLPIAPLGLQARHLTMAAPMSVSGRTPLLVGRYRDEGGAEARAICHMKPMPVAVASRRNKSRMSDVSECSRYRGRQQRTRRTRTLLSSAMRRLSSGKRQA